MKSARFHGVRVLAGVALATCVLVGIAWSDAPASSIPASAIETDAAPQPRPSNEDIPAPADAAVAIPPPSPAPSSEPTATTPTATTPESGSAEIRSDRDNGSRSRRPDRRRDQTESDESAEVSTNGPVIGTDFTSFRLIPDRNIFNVNRSARSTRPTRESAASRSVQVDSFALVGAMSYAKGDFAFFDGSGSEFRKVLKPGDSIGGFEVKSVGLNSVNLDASGKSLELAIGSHFRREDGGEWRMVAEPAPSSSTSSSRRERSRSYSPEKSDSGESPKTDATEAADSGGGANDILQRLMKMREQELVK